MARKSAVLMAVLAASFASATIAHATSLVPMGDEVASSRLAGIEPAEHAGPATRVGPPAAPAAQRAADAACPEAAAPSSGGAATPDAGVEVRGPRLERNATKPAWRWKSLLPGALK
jgi:hypothetical protein